ISGYSNSTQAAYDLFGDPFDGFLANETTALFVLDLFGFPATPATGLNTFFNDQYSSLYAWRSIANANYHALQVTATKRMGRGLQFDLNYTWSKSIDLMSDAERIGPHGGLGGEIINSWSHKQMRAVSDFDATHQVNANWI
ncbi:MAG: carboxypeptidase regulatory-like domain-containing protein, partial [Acidobacteria bacterium]